MVWKLGCCWVLLLVVGVRECDVVLTHNKEKSRGIHAGEARSFGGWASWNPEAVKDREGKKNPV